MYTWYCGQTDGLTKCSIEFTRVELVQIRPTNTRRSFSSRCSVPHLYYVLQLLILLLFLVLAPHRLKTHYKHLSGTAFNHSKKIAVSLNNANSLVLGILFYHVHVCRWSFVWIVELTLADQAENCFLNRWFCV